MAIGEALRLGSPPLLSMYIMHTQYTSITSTIFSTHQISADLQYLMDLVSLHVVNETGHGGEDRVVLLGTLVLD